MIKSVEAKESYTLYKFRDEIISIEIRRAKDIKSMYAEIDAPEICFKLKLNERIKNLSSKYMDGVEEGATSVWIISGNANVQIFANGDISIYFKPW